MSVRFQSSEVSKSASWVPVETGASFDREAEEAGEGLFNRQLGFINEILMANGVSLHRLDLRFQPDNSKARVNAFEGKCGQQNTQLMEQMTKEFVLPYQALQGLTIASQQDFAVTGADEASKKAGLFARTKDGGAMSTTGAGFGAFPKVDAVRNQNHPDLYRQPYRRLHSNASADGVSTNEFLTVFAGACTFYCKLGKKAPFKGINSSAGGLKDAIPEGFVKLDLNCDATTGWRVVYRGEVPHGLRVKEGMKFAWQVIGPEDWIPTFLSADPWTQYSLYGKVPGPDTDPDALPEAGRAPMQDVPEA